MISAVFGVSRSFSICQVTVLRAACVALLSLGALLIFTRAARAADYWWMGFGSDWWGGTPNWADVSHTIFLPAPSSADTAVFAGVGAINLNTTLGATNFSVLGVRTDSFAGFNSAASISSTGGILTVGSGGVSVTTPTTFTISAPLLTTSSAYALNVSNAGGTLALTGGLTTTAAGLTKLGGGTLVLSGANSYTGGTTINAGTLKLGASNAVPSSTNLHIVSGNFNLAGFNQSLGNITFGDGVTTAAASLVDLGASKGTLTLGGSIAFKGAPGAATPPALLAANISLSSGVHNITIPGGAWYSNGNYDVVVSGVLSGAGGLNVDSELSVALSNTNSYTGPTAIMGNCILFLAATNALPPQTAVTVDSGGFLNLKPSAVQTGVTPGNYNQSIGSLAGGGTIDLGSATLTIDSDNTSTTFSGEISAYSGSLVKVGTGTLTLSGKLAYTGATTIDSGKLVIDNVLSSTDLHGISGAGELVVAGSTELTATSINVGTLTITGSHGPFAAAAVPEPGTLVLLALAAAALAGGLWWRK